MVRTQVSLDEAEYAAAKQEAARLGLSMAEFVRRSIREQLPAASDKPWMRYADMVESGDWLFPHRGTELYSDKPPMLMWLEAAAYRRKK